MSTFLLMDDSANELLCFLVWPLRGGEGAYSFVACLSHLTVDHASLSRRSTVPAPNRDTSNIWAPIQKVSFMYYLETIRLSCDISFLLAVCGHHLPPDDDCFLASV